MHVDVKGKASASDVRNCVLRSHFEEVVVSLGETLDAKASETELRQLQKEMKVSNVYS